MSLFLLRYLPLFEEDTLLALIQCSRIEKPTPLVLLAMLKFQIAFLLEEVFSFVRMFLSVSSHLLILPFQNMLLATV